MVKFPSFTSKFHSRAYPAMNPIQNDELSARGKTVLISGGGTGVGRFIAEAFARAQAAHIILFGRSISSLNEAKAAVESNVPRTKMSDTNNNSVPITTTQVHVFRADIAVQSDLDALFAAIKTDMGIESGVVDILVNSAGYLSAKGTVATADPDDWWRGFDVVVRGGFMLTRAFLAANGSASAQGGGGGVLLNITSVCAHGGSMACFSSYNTSKAAFMRVLETVQVEAPHLRAISIHPGVYDTVMRRKSGNVSGPFDDGMYLMRPSFP
jgi:NAD(P)-dependent dehydrogenase (short-subunit alcohol dehydrogenase family)